MARRISNVTGWSLSEQRMRYYGWLLTVRRNVDLPVGWKWQARSGHALTRKNLTGFARSMGEAMRQAVAAARGDINTRGSSAARTGRDR